MALVWASAVPAPERFTLLALADRADEDGVCWPSIGTLAAKCCTGESTIRRHLRALKYQGVLTVQLRVDNSSVYTINLPRLRDLDQGAQSDTPQSGRGCQSGRGKQARPAKTDKHPRQSDTPHQTGSPSQIERGTPVNLSGDPSQIDTQYVIDTSGDTSSLSSETATPSSDKAKPRSEPDRDDVNALCSRLSEWIVHNGGRAPTITQDWRRQARLLLDQDKRELSKALSLIDWCQRNEFWHSRILGMPKFRKQYDQLVMQAREEWRRNGGRRAQAAPDPDREFARIRAEADGQTAARLIGRPMLLDPQPVDDDTDPRRWRRDRTVEWIDAHEAEIRSHLTQDTA